MKTFHHLGIEVPYNNLNTVMDNGRFYLTPEGNRYPSITTVLGYKSKDSLDEWKSRVGEEEAKRVSHHAATRGTAVHNFIEDYLNNKPLDLEQCKNLLVRANVKALIPILDKCIGGIFCQEFPLYSDHLKVAGRVDCIAEFNGKVSVIDFKTSAKPKKKEWITNYFIQESAYAIMFEERTGIPITQLVTIMSVDYHDPIVFIDHRDNWTDELIESIKEYNINHM